MIRQGDILFIPVKDFEGMATNARVRESGIIAEGEATGHHHRVAVEDMASVELLDMSWPEAAYLRVSADGVRIVHEEHGTVTLPAGTYKVHQAREFDYLAQVSRSVRD